MTSSDWGTIVGGLIGDLIGAFFFTYLISYLYIKGLKRQGRQYSETNVFWFRVVGTFILFLFFMYQNAGIPQH
jgi:hypothetical protein